MRGLSCMSLNMKDADSNPVSSVSLLLSPSACVLSSLHSWCCNKKKEEKSAVVFLWLCFTPCRETRRGEAAAPDFSWCHICCLCCWSLQHLLPSLWHPAHQKFKKHILKQPYFVEISFVTWLDSHCPVNRLPLFDTEQICGSGLMEPKGN